MDYNEIQLEELEALQAIYPNELKIINREYPNINVSFYFRPNEVCFFSPFSLISSFIRKN